MQQALNAQPRVCQPAFHILVVGRDVMSGHLLADALGNTSAYRAKTIPSASLLSAAAAGLVNLAVISVNLPSGEGAGLELARALYRAYPRVLIIMLLDQPKRDLVVSAFRHGARGVFSRMQGVEDFLECVEHVRRGGIWTGRAETEYLLEAFKNIPGPEAPVCGATSLLTRRETQVVCCAAQGKTNRTIAGELSLSEHTVKNYLFRAFEKLGVSSRVELLFYLTTQGIDLQANQAIGPLPNPLPPQSVS